MPAFKRGIFYDWNERGPKTSKANKGAWTREFGSQADQSDGAWKAFRAEKLAQGRQMRMARIAAETGGAYVPGGGRVNASMTNPFMTRETAKGVVVIHENGKPIVNPRFNRVFANNRITKNRISIALPDTKVSVRAVRAVQLLGPKAVGELAAWHHTYGDSKKAITQEEVANFVVSELESKGARPQPMKGSDVEAQGLFNTYGQVAGYGPANNSLNYRRSTLYEPRASTGYSRPMSYQG